MMGKQRIQHKPPSTATQWTPPTTKLLLSFLLLCSCVSHSLQQQPIRQLSSSPNKDPNYSFLYFNKITDPNMMMYESPVGYKNPYFYKMYFLQGSNGLTDMFVAGLDFLYKLNPSNIKQELNMRVNLTNHEDYKVLYEAAQKECAIRHRRKPLYTCTNIVQVVFKKSNNTGQLTICSSGFGYPQEFVIDGVNMKVMSVSKNKTDATGLGSGVGKCPGVPFMSFASIYIESEKAFFSSGPIDQDLQLRTRKSTTDVNGDVISYLDSKIQFSQTNVNYIASFKIDKYVYVFYYESPEERPFSYNEKFFYTRVARICQDDPGTWYSKNEFISYVKVRLLCMDKSHAYTYLYDVISDVVYDEVKDRFYVLSTTNAEEGSAICVYSRDSIDEIVSGEPLSGPDDSNLQCWVSKTENFMSPPRPCDCPGTDYSTMGLRDITYFLKYQLSSSFASPEKIEPVFTTWPISDVIYTRFVVETLQEDKLIYWMYSHSEPGHLTRIYTWKNATATPPWQWRRVGAVRLYKNIQFKSKLWDLKMVLVDGKQYVFATMEKLVVRLNLEMCLGHVKCTTCAIDPHCAWLVEGSKCIPIQDVAGRKPEQFISNPTATSALTLCENKCLKNTANKIVTSGSNVVIGCSSWCSPDDQSYPIWYSEGEPLFTTINRDNGDDNDGDGDDDPDNVIMIRNKNYNLYIINATQNLAGSYECRDASSNTTLARINLVVSKFCKIDGNFESTWRREFSNWCKSYEEYSQSFNNWKTQHCQNTECIKKCCSSQ